jgi:hypothetical protein
VRLADDKDNDRMLAIVESGGKVTATPFWQCWCCHFLLS